VFASSLWFSTKTLCLNTRLLISICNKISKTNLTMVSQTNAGPLRCRSFIWISFLLLLKPSPLSSDIQHCQHRDVTSDLYFSAQTSCTFAATAMARGITWVVACSHLYTLYIQHALLCDVSWSGIMGAVRKAFQLFLYLEHSPYTTRNDRVCQFIPPSGLLSVNFTFRQTN
jgi:hypothetical protein